MDLNLNDLGATVAIGVYLLFSTEKLFQQMFGRTTIFAKRVQLAGMGTWANLGLVSIFCFSIGMIAEDVSEKYADDRDLEELIRKDVLFTADGRLNALGRELYDVGLLSASTENNSEPLRGVINRIYYKAKNEVYKQDNYFSELGRIQIRIDFARSVSLVSAFLLVLSVAFSAIAVFRSFFADTWEASSFVCYLILKKLLISLLLFGLIILVSSIAYVAEETEFDKRVFGYYSSDLREDLFVETELKTLPSLSGVTLVEKNRYLAASDAKNPDGNRLFWVDWHGGKPRAYPAEVDWSGLLEKGENEFPNRDYLADVESLCGQRNAENNDVDVWMMESSGYKHPISKTYYRGRLVHLRADHSSLTNRFTLSRVWNSANFEVVGVYYLPRSIKNVEGMDCVSTGGNSWQFVVAERKYPLTGSVGLIDVGPQVTPFSELNWSREPVPLKVDLTDYAMKTDSDFRAISGLSLLPISRTNASEFAIWALGATDGGDASDAIYRGFVREIGRYQTNKISLVDGKLCRLFEGEKTEGLSISSDGTELVVVSDNEERGGGLVRFSSCK